MANPLKDHLLNRKVQKFFHALNVAVLERIVKEKLAKNVMVLEK
jgi:hypothetical protein